MAAAVNMPLLPLWLAGASYDAALDRSLLEASFREGVDNAAALKVTQRAAGTNMTVDVAAGMGYVQGNSPVGSRGYLIRSDAAVNVGLDAAPGANSRIDLIVATVEDPAVAGSGTNRWKLQAVTGVAAASPAVPATPANALKLAEILVASGTAAITDAMVTDARGPMRTVTSMALGSFLPRPQVGQLAVADTTGDLYRAVTDTGDPDGVSWLHYVAGLLEVEDLTGNHYGGAPPDDDLTRWKVYGGRQGVTMFGGAGTLKIPKVLSGLAVIVFSCQSNTQGITVGRRTTGSPSAVEIHGSETWVPITAYSTDGTARSGTTDQIDYLAVGWV